MNFSPTFADDRSRHDDVVLILGDHRDVCDSYYFAIDHTFMPSREDGQKVRIVLTVLLERWIEAITSSPTGHTVFLPYDFSDQYTGCIQCERVTDTDLHLTLGYSKREGWAVMPSNPGDYFQTVSDFTGTGLPESCSLAVFVTAIHTAISELGVDPR